MSSTFSNLKFELITTGEQSGTWGGTTNTNIGTAIEQAIVGMATLTSSDFTANVATLTLVDLNTAQNARALCLNIAAGAVAAAGTINVPAIQKPYIIINGSSYAVTVKVSGQTGVSVPAGKRTVVYNNGTDVGDQIDYLATLALGTPLSASNGGLGATSVPTAGTIPIGTSSGTYLANPLIGGSGISVTSGSGTLSIATTFTPSTANNWTATQTFTGSASQLGAKLVSFSQVGEQVSGSAGGSVTQHIATQQVVSYSNYPTSNWDQNLTFSGSATLDSVMAVGDMVTATQVVISGASGYYPTAFYVDGNVTTPIWANGVVPSAVVVPYTTAMYTYKLLKIGSGSIPIYATVDVY